MKPNFEIIDHGCEHGQYFQGCGVSFTPFLHVVTGVADTPADALEDAISSLYDQAERPDDEALTAIEAEAAVLIANAPATAHKNCHEDCRQYFDGTDEQFERSHEMCEIAYRVSIRFGRKEG